jgi:hypothetical protein
VTEKVAKLQRCITVIVNFPRKGVRSVADALHEWEIRVAAEGQTKDWRNLIPGNKLHQYILQFIRFDWLLGDELQNFFQSRFADCGFSVGEENNYGRRKLGAVASEGHRFFRDLNGCMNRVVNVGS